MFKKLFFIVIFLYSTTIFSQSIINSLYKLSDKAENSIDTKYDKNFMSYGQDLHYTRETKEVEAGVTDENIYEDISNSYEKHQEDLEDLKDEKEKLNSIDTDKEDNEYLKQYYHNQGNVVTLQDNNKYFTGVELTGQNNDVIVGKSNEVKIGGDNNNVIVNSDGTVTLQEKDKDGNVKTTKVDQNGVKFSDYNAKTHISSTTEVNQNGIYNTVGKLPDGVSPYQVINPGTKSQGYYTPDGQFIYGTPPTDGSVIEKKVKKKITTYKLTDNEIQKKIKIIKKKVKITEYDKNVIVDSAKKLDDKAVKTLYKKFSNLKTKKAFEKFINVTAKKYIKDKKVVKRVTSKKVVTRLIRVYPKVKRVVNASLLKNKKFKKMVYAQTRKEIIEKFKISKEKKEKIKKRLSKIKRKRKNIKHKKIKSKAEIMKIIDQFK